MSKAGQIERKGGRRSIDNVRPFAYQRLSVIYHKIFIELLSIVKVRMLTFFNS